MVQVYTLLGEMSYFSLVTSVYRGIERKKKKKAMGLGVGLSHA